MVIATAPERRSSTVQEIGARDVGIDLVRAFCVLGVVVIHSMMVGVTVTDAGPLFANASEGSTWIAPLSWVLQVMPLFFVIGGFAGITSYRRAQARGGTAAAFVAGRIHRLILPAIFTIAVVGVALSVLLFVGVPAEFTAIAGYRFSQPLWFLGVFLMCQVLLPAMVAAHRHAPWLTISSLAAVAVVVDAVRGLTGIEGIGFVNLAFVWLTLQQLGFFFSDGRIDSLSRRSRTVMASVAVTGLVLAFGMGIYSPDLIANINPPTAALLLVGVAHTMLLSLFRDRLRIFSLRPFPARFSAFVTPRAMSIYLWHMPVLLTMAGVTAAFAMVSGLQLPEPSSAQWWLTRPAWLATVIVLTAGVVCLFARLEARRAPAPTRSTARLVAASATGLIAIVGLLVFSTTPMTAALSVALLVFSLRWARADRSRDSDTAAVLAVTR